MIAAAVAAVAGRAFGYVVLTDQSGVYVVKWQSSPITMNVKLSGTANLLDGTSPRSSVAAAMRLWNTNLGAVRFAPILSEPGSYANGNGVSEIAMDNAEDGYDFPADVLAVTIRYMKGEEATEDDIVINEAYAWNSYRGPLRAGIHDLRRVVLHELGHALGLQHPDRYGQDLIALMNSYEGDIDTLQLDDIMGAQSLYGAPGVMPANDRFADAEIIALTEKGSLQLSGSNVAATHEAGEPDHAGSAGRHSAWWKWTATAQGAMVVTTLDSDFDTVLAVYAGTKPGAIAPVASNNDEESVAQNPTPWRKRTSKVAFATSAGTTYFIAVDGWGGSGGPASGFTGAIVLNFDFTDIVAPRFTTSPADSTVQAGLTASFTAVMSGRPFPEGRWQRHAAGGGDWTDLQAGDVYGIAQTANPDYTGSAALSLKTDYTMEGDQFRCVATNLGGEVVSDVAVLHVTPIPLPGITVQPRGGKFLMGVSGRISVEATGAESYQWFHDGLPLPGQTGPLLFFPSPKPSDAGDYHVVLSNAGGEVTSATATITVGSPAVITNRSPTRQLVKMGQRVTLTVAAKGTGALSYQWYHDGRPVAGAAESACAVNITSPADAGAYWVAVTDDAGTRYGAPFFAILSHARTGVVAWGANFYGQMMVPPTLSDAVAISAAPAFVLALRREGSVVAWGDTGGMRTGFTGAVTVAAGGFGAIALRADGTVEAAGDAAVAIPAGLREVWAIACSDDYALALKTDGTVVSWGDGETPAVNGLEDIVAVSATLVLRRDGLVSFLYPAGTTPWPDTLEEHIVAVAGSPATEWLGLNADGTIARTVGLYPAPASAVDVVAIAAGQAHALALKADGTCVAWDGSNAHGEVSVPAGLKSVFAIAAGGNSSYAIRDLSAGEPVLVTAQPGSQAVAVGGEASLVAYASGLIDPPQFQWRHDGRGIPGETAQRLTIGDVQPAAAGIYTAVIAGGGVTGTSDPALVGVVLPDGKMAGEAAEVASDISHPNGNVFDQVLMTGAAAAVKVDPGQVTRTSYVDLNGDIVQVELSGPGTLSLVLDDCSGPALPENYTQAVRYMKGHAGIVVAGAGANTNLSVFAVGRATAFDPTGRYNFLLLPGATNNPADNASPLFTGHAATRYDGIADLAYVAITSGDGKFGGIRAANAHFFATRGLTGIYAPGVAFAGPVYVGEITAYDEATAMIRLGSAGDVRITGGSLAQDPSANGRAVQVSGITQLRFTAGLDSSGNILPAQQNRAVLEEDGKDVTAAIVSNPGP